jgi:hypothetical protein
MSHTFCCVTGACTGHTSLMRDLERLYRASCDDPGLTAFGRWEHLDQAAAYLARQVMHEPIEERGHDGEAA